LQRFGNTPNLCQNMDLRPFEMKQVWNLQHNHTKPIKPLHHARFRMKWIKILKQWKCTC